MNRETPPGETTRNGHGSTDSSGRFLVPMYLNILTVFLILVGMIAGTLLYFQFQQGHREAELAATDAMSRSIGQIIDRVRLEFEPVRTLVRTAIAEDAARAPPTSGQHPMEDWLSSYALLFPQIYSAYMGFSDGAFYSVIAVRDEKVRAGYQAPEGVRLVIRRNVVRPEDGRRIEFTSFLNEGGFPIVERTRFDPAYDPRARPWYEHALVFSGLSRTGIYTYSVSQQLGLTFVHKLPGPVEGVFGVDITLEALSGFMAGQTVTPSSIAFMFSRSGVLFAYPDPDVLRVAAPDGTVRPARIADIGRSEIARVYSFFQSGFESGTRRFLHEGRTYVMAIGRVPEPYGVDEYVAVLAPFDEIVAPILEANRQGLLLSLILLAISVPFVVLVSRQIARPLVGLQNQAERIGRLELDRDRSTDSYIREIHNLSTAMDGMTNALRTFERYVPKALVEKIVISRTPVELGGESRRLTVLFTDIADFTTLAEYMEPGELMRLTSRYFEVLSGVLLKHGATIDKFIGDAVMAFWNAPGDDPDHARNACMAVIEARAAVDAFNAANLEQGLPVMQTRFGLHTGETVVGNLGSSDRMNYTAIGAMVNLASRVEGMNKIYGTRALMTADAVAEAGIDILTRRIDTVIAKGAMAPVEIYELIGPFSECSDTLGDMAAWTGATEAFRTGDFAAAVRGFETYLGTRPDDAVARRYCERAREYMITPPAYWDGVTRFEAK